MAGKWILVAAGMGLLLFSLNCGTSPTEANKAIPDTAQYVVFAWNDLGMHCLNPTYDQAVILPPYNTVWAQVIKRGNPPQIVTTGLTAQYRIIDNTHSYSKRSFSQFWDNAKKLFGTDLQQDKGLNLVDPNLHNGLAGEMVNRNDHFEVDGIPLTPVDDSGNWNPFQVAEITIKNAGGTVVAQTRTTTPTSDDINCGKCHGANAFADILQKHDSKHGTALQGNKPILCASCHASPALGMTSSSGNYLSKNIHKSHATRGAACYDCHPGEKTSCNRSKAHTAADGNCTSCHGDMNNVANTIATGARTPWVNEPKCATCHAGVPQVDTGTTLYRNAMGHGNVYCASCHSSPHAMVPSTQASDNYQAMQYQGKAKTIGSCGVCHQGSKGESGDIGEFGGKHGGANPDQKTACNICHTATPSETTKWPHKYQWKNR
ncbi:MAG TPA: cytochrome c3 family protein [bacterium]|nr:cytochrome c3 family protein [bacterium]HPR88012.1 cytochrome c3 family protein [bacterium]